MLHQLHNVRTTGEIAFDPGFYPPEDHLANSTGKAAAGVLMLSCIVIAWHLELTVGLASAGWLIGAGEPEPTAARSAQLGCSPLRRRITSSVAAAIAAISTHAPPMYHQSLLPGAGSAGWSIAASASAPAGS